MNDGAGGSDDAAAVLGDAELGGVLVLASYIIDDLDAVAVGALSGLKGGGRSPGKATTVGNALSERGTELDDVGGGTLEEKDRDSVGGSWLPGDGKGLAGRDNLVQRTGDGVTAGVANWGVDLGGSEASEDGDDGSLGEHVCGVYGIIRLSRGWAKIK